MNEQEQNVHAMPRPIVTLTLVPREPCFLTLYGLVSGSSTLYNVPRVTRATMFVLE